MTKRELIIRLIDANVDGEAVIWVRNDGTGLLDELVVAIVDSDGDIILDIK